jgi:hypothetical protein
VLHIAAFALVNCMAIFVKESDIYDLDNGGLSLFRFHYPNNYDIHYFDSHCSMHPSPGGVH